MENKEKKIGVFDIINSISNNRQYPKIEDEDAIDSAYIPFIINRQFSYFGDTLFVANEMNRYSDLPKDMQYEFYLHTVKPSKRFTKWAKEKQDTFVTALSQLMYISEKEAMMYTNLFTDEEKDDIVKLNKIKEGGRLGK